MSAPSAAPAAAPMTRPFMPSPALWTPHRSPKVPLGSHREPDCKPTRLPMAPRIDAPAPAERPNPRLSSSAFTEPRATVTGASRLGTEHERVAFDADECADEPRRQGSCFGPQTDTLPRRQSKSLPWQAEDRRDAEGHDENSATHAAKIRWGRAYDAPG